MSYLLTQIFLYLLVAFVLGLILGWLIWRNSGGSDTTSSADLDALRGERDSLRAERDNLRAQLEACGADKTALQSRLDALTELNAAPAAAAAAAPVVETVAEAPVVEASRPEGLTAARNGQPDDLKRISGVGPKMERLCNGLGFYHFDQIAAWTPAEVAWVDENLEGFKGRVTRDNWIAQAKELARETS